jgi:hypothetical protein
MITAKKLKKMFSYDPDTGVFIRKIDIGNRLKAGTIGVEMSDMGDDFREWRKHKQAKKETNRKSSTQMLADAGYEFESHNSGVHLIIKLGKVAIDYWPSTGLYQSRGWRLGLKGRGIKSLLRSLDDIKRNPFNL